MKVHLKAMGFRAGEAIQEHVLRRISAALAHWADQVHRVVVRLSDNNGPRGGVDKSCSIQLEGPMGIPVVVTAVSPDFYTSVDLAARRAGRAAQRVFDRQRS